jgi:hypothetical protein
MSGGKKSRSSEFETVVRRLGPRSAPPVTKSPLVRIGGIKATPRNIVKSRRIGGGGRGGSHG